jgi:phage/plasmid-associated DNA primase
MELFQKLLDQKGVRVFGNEPYTHQTKACLEANIHQGKYYYPPETLDNLLKAYCNAVSVGNKLTFMEAPDYKAGYAPLRADFDFKADLNTGTKRQYTVQTLKAIVKFYQEEIRDIVDPDVFNEEMLTCIVLEKECPRVEQGYIKDGFHLHFPNFICDERVQDYYIRNKINTKMIASNIWANTKFITKPNAIIDTGIFKKPWLMYGSMNYKDQKSTPYIYNRRQPYGTDGPDPWSKVTEDKQYGHVFDHELNEIAMIDVFYNDMVGRGNSIKYYLPQFMSIRGHTEKTILNEEIEKQLVLLSASKKGTKRKQFVNKVRGDEDIYQDYKTILDGHIMEMLSEDRAHDHDQWMDVGWTLFNIMNGKEEGLHLWIDFSQKSSKYRNGECEELWNSMEMRNKTIGSLLAMARADNPQMYKQWKDTNINNFLYKSVLPGKSNEYDVAKVVECMSGDRFKCVDGKHDIWYEFRDHRWHQLDDNISIKKMLVEDVIQKYFEFSANLGLEARDLNGMGEAEKAAKKMIEQGRAIVIIERLKSCGFHDKVIRMCKIYMYDGLFMKRMNENRMIFCCENGVLDLELGLFRDGRPDDYCTFSCGQYYQEYHAQDDDVLFLEDFLLKTYPNKNIRDYNIDALTACLQGGNVNKRIYMGTGGGDNAKTCTFGFIEGTFGDYYGKFPRELFIRGKGNSSGSARPELAGVRGKRIMSTQELTHKEEFDIGILKELSGNDSFWSRGLYEKGSTIKPMFTIWLQMNKPPKLPGDDATWSRIRIIPYEAKFVKPQDLEEFPVPDTLEKQLKMKRFYADPNFGENSKFLSTVLLWKLFHNFKEYKKNGLREPKEVMLATNDYKAENDIYEGFINDRLERVEDEEDAKKEFIRATELFNQFKSWFRENYPTHARTPIGNTEIKNELVKRLGETKKDTSIYGFNKMNRLLGYKLQKVDEDEKQFL